MKLDRRYHCFGCGVDGDVIDFAAALYGLGKKEAAVQLAQDFGLSYEDWKPPEGKKAQDPAEIPGGTVSGSKESLLPYSCRLSPSADGMENGLRPALPGEPFIPRFVEALQKQAQVEYLLDVCCSGKQRKKRI